MVWRRRCRRIGFVAGAVSLVTLLTISQPRLCCAYTVDSPEVKALVAKGVTYLEAKGKSRLGVGADALVALALYKAGEDTGHPMVQYGLNNARALAAKGKISHNCYNEAIACVVLCELDAKGSYSEINAMLGAIVNRQRPNGCWGYDPHTGDDTSQTQYGLLALWAAYHHEFNVPANSVERAANWLARTQDISGGHTYMPNDRGTFQRGRQGTVTHSMSAAGAGSLYVSAHLLGFSADANKVEKQEDDGIPDALVRVEKEKKKSKYLTPTNTSAAQIRGAASAGDAWFAKNFTYDVDKWTHYYMYGFERYMSFREFVEGKTVDEPAWYNEGVEFLKKTQHPDGSWRTKESHGSGPQVDTAFAVLFLTRSSKKSIGDAVLDEGVLIAGKGLPKNTMNIQMDGGKVVTPQMVQDVDDLLKLIKDADNAEFDATALPGGLTLDDDLTKRTSQLERLRQMVTDEDFNTRFAAVKTLARARELDNVPALIYALSDPDPQVVREARDGLRFISRKFFGFQLSDTPSEDQVKLVQDKWEAWYLSIRPDGELLE